MLWLNSKKKETGLFRPDQATSQKDEIPNWKPEVEGLATP